MTDAWHEFEEGRIVEDIEQLRLPRARAVAQAVLQHRDFELVQCSTPLTEDALNETLIVDVQCDGVPEHNSLGIEFRERLLLRVPKDTKQIVEVFALRKNFPILMHQNHVMPGTAPNLCLYYEPSRAVLRTWTPQDFLRRIQTWLERTASGTLHPADQPVEQLFFTTPFQLILPWDFSTLCNDTTSKFFIFRGAEKLDGGVTYFLRSSIERIGNTPGVRPVQIVLPAVVHGRIELDPQTLGDLADLLQTKNIDFLQTLKTHVQLHVDDNGTSVSLDDRFAMLLLHIPIIRDETSKVECVIHRAYLLDHGILELGTALGALFLQNGTYYKEQSSGILAPAQKDDWRSKKISAIEVLSEIDRHDARQQSGISDEGSVSVLVGVGSLGASMLDLWTRSGWGQWTVIDHDYIKPHNLVRHPADARHLGSSKVDVACLRHDEIMQGASVMDAIHTDACELGDEKQLIALRSSALIVDASTTLDYPRLVSAHDDFSRHVSVFVTPSGTDSVLMLEDKNRLIRLRTLEAQYYRELINSDWGGDHLHGNLGTFWSGASCRDISMVMPYSRILGHAATLSEQIRLLANHPDAAIRVWSKDEISGEVTSNRIDVYPERQIPMDGLDLFIDEGLIAKMNDLRNAALPNETGGIILGYFDFNIKAIIIVDVLVAPTDSKSDKHSFERGVAGASQACAEANRRTAEIVNYVGEWHSHPSNCSANPSNDDFYQLAYLSIGMSQVGLRAISLIIGEGGDLRAMSGEVCL